MKHIVLTAYLLATLSAAAEVEITSFHSSGMLTWTNSEPPAICHVEWASNLTSGWSRSWAGLVDIAMTSHSCSAAVPMFYRVVCESIDLQEGLALYLPFDGNTTDLSTNSTDGTNIGATLTADMNGDPTNAYYFAYGGNAQIYVPDGASLDVTNITLSFLFKQDSYQTANMLVSKYGTDGNCSFTAALGPQFLWWRVTPNGLNGSSYACQSMSAVQTGVWHHAVATYDGQSMALYLNGTNQASRSVSGSIHNSSEPLRIRTYGFFPWYYHGTIDEVAIWNRALTSSEIAVLHALRGKL